MAVTSLNDIKQWFKTNLKPTQTQFWALLDSFWHKDEQIPLGKIEGLQGVLDEKTDVEVFDNHLTDKNSHSNLFNTKVDKAAGMGLSQNDFTDELLKRLQNIGKVEIVNASRNYDANDNYKTLVVTADCQLNLVDNLPADFNVTIYSITGTLTNTSDAPITMSPSATSVLTDGKMQFIFRNPTDANDFIITGENK